ncbi:MAG: hypothetical protein KAR12_15880, partial [Methylococcales bacterium]|nr:hypothetical protein [Methylococcales bacterium]
MRKLKLGICNFCEVKKGIVAKGLCRACYQRKQKTGSLEYKRNGRNICSVVDCDDFVVTMGLCDKHRQRVVKHGSIEQTRPVDWGKREKHPLYGTWISIRRSRNRSMCIEWRNDFWRFVKDVKEKPSKAHKIKPKDPDSVFSKDNYYWHLPIPYNKEGNEIRNALLREDRKQNPDKYRHAALMKSFGIGLIEYNKMSHGQSNVCAICKEP